jgi:hypothetical protein
MFEYICCGAPFAVTAVFILLWRRKNLRGFQADYGIDSATCLKADNGDVVIRRHLLRDVILLIIFAAAFVGIILVLINILRGVYVQENWYDFLILISIAIFLGIVIYNLVLTIRRPPILINALSQTVEIGHGRGKRILPFTQISHVALKRLRGIYLGQDLIYRFGLVFVLHNRQEIPIGSLSGFKIRQKAETVLCVIGESIFGK